MTLTVVFADMWASYNNCMFSGLTSKPACRTVHIELTEEQVKLLDARTVGVNGGKDVRETIIGTWIEAE